MAPPSTIPVLHYLDIGSFGRGEVIRLFLKDADIEFKDMRYKYDDSWPATSKALQEKGISKTGKVPELEYNGLILSQHIPILRYLAREIGTYDPETSHDKYLADAVSDLYVDWRSQWVAQLSKKTDEYKNEFAPKYYDLLASYYSEKGGPFLLGNRISYVDFPVYQSIDNDEKIGMLPAKLPEAMQKFRQAFEARPRVAAYLNSDRATTRD